MRKTCRLLHMLLSYKWLQLSTINYKEKEELYKLMHIVIFLMIYNYFTLTLGLRLGASELSPIVQMNMF